MNAKQAIDTAKKRAEETGVMQTIWTRPELDSDDYGDGFAVFDSNYDLREDAILKLPVAIATYGREGRPTRPSADADRMWGAS